MKSDTITFEGNGVTVDNNIVIFNSAGTYIISGTIRNGQVRVDTDDKADVRLILNGGQDSAPLYVTKAKNTVIVLAEGAKNSLTTVNLQFKNMRSDEPD